MILFFKYPDGKVIAVGTATVLQQPDIEKLLWLFEGSGLIEETSLKGTFTGPRKDMISPWSTNAVEVTRNMGISGINRIEELCPADPVNPRFDYMLQDLYNNPGQDIFASGRVAEPVTSIGDIARYNETEGLALNPDEIGYLNDLSASLGRPLTDSEVFGFSQVNSEHCRHKIFNGTFIIDGKEKESTLFQMIKETTHSNRNSVVSAYKDNCAFIKGPGIEQFAPSSNDKPDYYGLKTFDSVLSMKAETHNFPTTVEPFNGGATGSGGEIRDRMAGGKGAFPIAGTAVYMTAYPRSGGARPWEKSMPERPWLYRSPGEILITASNGASDFGNKHGHPVICGSLLTFEHTEHGVKYGFDKVIMMAGGIGTGKIKDSSKGIPEKGDLVIMLGGDNYRIGMGGGAVSSVDTGQYHSAIELNAVQRSNPDMQKRVYNVIRALCEMDNNPIVSIHDHGAGGHLNCLSELVEATGGKMDISKFPVGDPSLSAREIIGNESQERMGLILKPDDLPLLAKIAERERAPYYVIGEITGDHRLVFENSLTGEKPMDLELDALFGELPKTIMTDQSQVRVYKDPEYSVDKLDEYLEHVLQLEEVACKDWLTNKVDRSAGGLIAKQQCAGPLQLPLNNLGAISLDFRGKHGMATSIGHAPVAALADPEAGSVLAIAEALTNIVWAPLDDKIRGVSLSANWMWPCRNEGENARLYSAVQAASKFAISLGINIPTGKDSLSMTQKYDDQVVLSPGTVIISAAAAISDIRKIVEPVIVNDPFTSLLYIDMSRDNYHLGGSCLAQVLNSVGQKVPVVKDHVYFTEVFNTVQTLIEKNKILAGHDISAGGMITTLLEMCFANVSGGLDINLNNIDEPDIIKLLFSQNPGIIVQVKDENEIAETLRERGISYFSIGHPIKERIIRLKGKESNFEFDIDRLRDTWFKTSFLLDSKQSEPEKASERYRFYKTHDVSFNMSNFDGSFQSLGINPLRQETSGIKAAIIREKGVNGDRELAYALWLAGFDVRDVHMTDLISGNEKLTDINMLVFPGGFSNSDVPVAARGWSGAFRFNNKAAGTLEDFYNRADTLSLGIGNGCQLMNQLELIYTGNDRKLELLPNRSGKFESGFTSVKIPLNNSVMFGNLSGMNLGAWYAHREGRFVLPASPAKYNVVLQFSQSTYPANPNGSDNDVAGLCSDNGRHVALMPHIERAIFPWQCGYYPAEKRNDEITPWIRAFINARLWIKDKISGS